MVHTHDAYRPATRPVERRQYALVLFGSQEAREVRGVLGRFWTVRDAELFAVEARFADYAVAPVCPVGGASGVPGSAD